MRFFDVPAALVLNVVSGPTLGRRPGDLPLALAVVADWRAEGVAAKRFLSFAVRPFAVLPFIARPCPAWPFVPPPFVPRPALERALAASPGFSVAAGLPPDLATLAFRAPALLVFVVGLAEVMGLARVPGDGSPLVLGLVAGLVFLPETDGMTPIAPPGLPPATRAADVLRPRM